MEESAECEMINRKKMQMSKAMPLRLLYSLIEMKIAKTAEQSRVLLSAANFNKAENGKR